MVRVMIVEDQKIIRDLLETYIQNEDGYETVVSIPAARQAVEWCDAVQIDLILMDVQTERHENGLAAAEKIKRKHPNIRIVGVTSLVDHEVLRRARASGMDSFWYKDTDEETLMDVVRRAMAGERVFPDAPPEVAIGGARSTDFTRTELKILRYLVRGMSYNGIAEAMGIQAGTVKFHISNMLQKTNLENKLQLALAVSNMKLVAELAEEEE